MRAGQLTERVALQKQRVTGRDALNAPIIQWVNQAMVWAAVETLTGRESHAADQIQNPVTLRVLIRVGISVEPSWRIEWWDNSTKMYRYLSIAAVLPSTKHDSLTLLCSEGLNNG